MTEKPNPLRETAILVARTYYIEEPEAWTDQELIDFCTSLGYTWNETTGSWERPAAGERRGRTFQSVRVDQI